MKKYLKTFTILILIILCFLYLKKSATYTSYSSNVKGEVDPKIAAWKIYINNIDVTTEIDKEVEITDIDWSGNRVRDGKVAPGSIGKMKIEINPTESDVAVRYDIEILDKTIDDTLLLKLHNITQSSAELIKTGENTYSSIITLDMLKQGIKPELILDIAWENDDSINDLDHITSDDRNFLKINFKATQYLGEEIIPYS